MRASDDAEPEVTVEARDQYWADRYWAGDTLLEVEQRPQRLVLRGFPIFVWGLAALCLLGGLLATFAGLTPNLCPGLGCVGLGLFVLYLGGGIETWTFDRETDTVVCERRNLGGRKCEERTLNGLYAVRVQVLNKGGCKVMLYFRAEEPVSLLGSNLGNQGVWLAKKVRGFANLETPLELAD